MELDDICRRFGIRTDYGPDAPVPDATKHAILTALDADPERPPEAPPSEPVEATEGVACYCPDWLIERPAWGVFCQLYELRSDRNWGIGDFRDLADMARIAAAAGADFLGINPVHALFPAAPGRRSPFMPSNRRLLNPIYIAMDDLPAQAAADSAALDAARTGDLVDYDALLTLKYGALRRVFAARPFGGVRYTEAAFNDFERAGGAALRNHALFDALSIHLSSLGHDAGWKAWPEAFRDPNGPEAERFARERADEVAFHIWLQWIASVQLAAARDAAREAGMRIGIYLDLAVGEALDGSASWSSPESLLDGLTVGAPPDVFSQTGQNWDLAAPSPVVLAENDFEMFRQLIRAQLTYAGALRVDHAMALWQLFLIPMGEEASTGTHLRYPFEGLTRVLAEESEKAGSVMIGEDLGWVPPGFREATQALRLLGYRILYFEQEWCLFRRKETYPQMSLACLSTHDLPTLGEWWRGSDTALRREHGLIDEEAAEADLAQRSDERRALVAALIDDGQESVRPEDGEADDLPERVLIAAYRFLAGTRCLLTGVRLADLVGPAEATNVPGTVEAYPNWQLKAPVPLEEIAAQPVFRSVTAAMREVRPKGA